MATWTYYQNVYWIKWPNLCCECASWTKGVYTFSTQVGPTRGAMLRRKYELEEKHVYKLFEKQIKNCSKQLKK